MQKERGKLNHKNTFNILFILIFSFFLFGYFIATNNPIELLYILKNAEKQFLLLAFICIVFYWILDGVSLYLVSSRLAPKFHLKMALQTSMLGQLFNCITPFASGGQPIQAYRMVKYGVNLGNSTSILLAKFIIYQTILTIYSLVVLIFKFHFFLERISNFSYLVFIGFAINTFVVLFLLSIGFFPRFTKKTMIALLSLLAKMKLVKKEEEKKKNIETEFSNFYVSFHYLKKHGRLILENSMIVFFQLTFFYLIPYFICLALGAEQVSLWNVVSAGAFVLMISSFVPLPGASGGSEGSFYLFFSIFFQRTGSIGIAIFLWRIITFYITILIGILFSKPVRNREK